MIKNKRLFITGGAGFIGSTIIGRLIEDNNIIVYDDFRRDALSSKPFAHHPNLTIVRGDILDLHSIKASINDAQIVIHCAAIAGIDTVIKKPTDTIRVNTTGTANALEAARSIPHLERFVDFSTSEVFGQSAFRVHEDMITHIGKVGEARWTYAISKLLAEHLTKAYHDEFGMPTTTVRPFNVYGPGQVGEGAMKIFIERAMNNDDIFIHGDGNQIRAWCYVDDFVEGLLLAATDQKAIGESLNIGNARAVVTIYGLAQTVVRVLGSKSKIKFVEKNYADVELRIPSVTKARDLLGFEAKIDLEEGIALTAEYLKEKLSVPV